MILFFNLIQTNDRRAYDRLHLSKPDYIDVWKYTLASLTVIPWWTKVSIYCQFDPEFKHRRDEAEAYVHELFPTVPVEFHDHRNVYQPQWQAALEPLMNDDPLIWFFNNDDHIFMDYSLECLEEIHNYMLTEEPSTCYLSHFPETLRVAANRPNAELRNLSVKINHVAVDSIQIVHRDILKQWFWGKNYGFIPIRRSDALPIANGSQPMHVPLRELCRHFDGYTHIVSDVNACPPLDIPPGFFENDIKITYCSPTRQEGKVHLNPLSKTHFAFDGEGPDYHWRLDDIPLFWKDRITEIAIKAVADPGEVVRARNESHTRKALMFHKSTWTIREAMMGRKLKDPPLEWIQKGFRNEQVS